VQRELPANTYIKTYIPVTCITNITLLTLLINMYK